MLIGFTNYYTKVGAFKVAQTSFSFNDGQKVWTPLLQSIMAYSHILHILLPVYGLFMDKQLAVNKSRGFHTCQYSDQLSADL